MTQVVLLGRIKNCPSLDIHDENGRILSKFFAFYCLLDSCTVCSMDPYQISYRFGENRRNKYPFASQFKLEKGVNKIMWINAFTLWPAQACM